MQRKATQAHQVSRGLCSLSEKYLFIISCSPRVEGGRRASFGISCHSVMCVVRISCYERRWRW